MTTCQRMNCFIVVQCGDDVWEADYLHWLIELLWHGGQVQSSSVVLFSRCGIFRNRCPLKHIERFNELGIQVTSITTGRRD